MKISDLMVACEAHPPAAILLAPDDYSTVRAFVERATQGDWLLTDRGAVTYRGKPIVPSRYGRRSYLVEDTPEGPLIHEIG